jgi:demethylmenaquinone methyltransferase/2-methoxy-6-polyprenyl-1,4-benzoquinol methylase
MTSYKKVTPYGDEENKKGQVTQMFDSIAPYYDYLNRFLSLGIDITWRNKLIAKLKPLQPKRILDVATGTADLAVSMAKALKPDAVVGMDISKEMLKVGDKKILKKGLDKTVVLEHGDSENLKYNTGEFDAVTAAFGVRNFENLKAGLQEMHRVLAPGGHIMILEFSRPRVFPIKQLFNAYFKYLLPVIGRLKSKDPKAYQYLYESVQVFPDYDQFTGILSEVGFSETSYQPLSFGICTIYVGIK